MNILVKTCAVNDDVNPCASFVDFVKYLLNNPAEREHFFTEVFPKEFGPSYDKALKSLMELFLSRLETFLPGQTFQQVATTCGEVSSVLGDSLKTMRSCDALRTLLRHHKSRNLLGHNDIYSDDTSIVSALKCAAVKDIFLQETLACTSSPHKEAKTTTTGNRGMVALDEAPGMVECASKEIPNNEENVESQMRTDSCVEGKTLDGSLQSGSLCLNQGPRTKTTLAEENKVGLGGKEELPVKKSVSSSMKASMVIPSDYSDIEDNGSEESSWSFYSDEDSRGYPSPWSGCSGEDVTSVGSSPNVLNKVTPVRNEDKLSAACSTKRLTSQKSAPQKKPRQVMCFICNEQVSTNLKTHLRTHFPDGQYTCPQCNSRFKLFSSLKKHLVKKCYEHAQQRAEPGPDQDLYKCDGCEKAFKHSRSLEAHKQTHAELYCGVCRKVLKDAASLERHKASHTEFRCTRCEQTFTLFKPLRRHYQYFHKISRPFKCICCSKTFSRLEHLIRHEWRDTGQLPLKCNICAMGFRSDYDLVSHQRVHTKEKPYLCGECGKTFSQKPNLLRHHRLIHSEQKDEKKYFCAECQTSFKEKGALLQHQKRKHLNEVTRSRLCPYCGKSFSASSIARHKLIHTGERPLKCNAPDCDKTFLTATERKKHFLMHHSTERPFKCDICGKGFITVGIRNEHVKLHSGKKPFVCEICIKGFSKRHTLNRHKKLVHDVLS
ncbi:zinc finger protein 572-like isoform X2 [Hippocampus comes]|nr:PREDICTED: zinc finger protein 572-like isoform X2 [Hippocampus comes]